MNLSPWLSMLINVGIGVVGVLESTGATHMIATQAGSPGMIAATVLAFLNAGAHSISAPQAGPLASGPSTPAK